MGAQLVQSQSDSLSMIFIVRSMPSLERKMKGGGRRNWGTTEGEKEEKRDKRQGLWLESRTLGRGGSSS